MLPDARLNLTFGLFPNPLALWDSPAVVTVFLVLLLLAALAFAGGICRRSAAIFLWFGWACLFNRNNLITNPSIPYVGLLLLLSAVVPLGEGWTFTRSRSDWRFPASVYWVAWLLLAAGYSYSGWVKLSSPSWIDGSALLHILENPLARPGPLRGALLLAPPLTLRVASWLSLAPELAFLPLSFCLTTRSAIWFALTVLQLVILGFVNFADLTFAMLLAHFFVFDPRWLSFWRVAAFQSFDDRLTNLIHPV
ncbi:MAG: hypothetical protein H0X40_02815 [Chthoniobacterales bacterium]|nr:hypothetical protein [Chthoniobacterales bacterium]